MQEITQKLKAERVMVPDVLSLSESIAILKGEYTHISDTIENEMKTNYLTKQQGLYEPCSQAKKSDIWYLPSILKGLTLTLKKCVLICSEKIR